MQVDARALIDAIQGVLVNEELLHDSVDMVYLGSDLNELTDDFTNIMLVTNLVHTRLMEVAEEVDIIMICYSHGHMPKPKEIQRAKELEIDMVTTPLSLDQLKRIFQKEFADVLEVKSKI